MDTAQGSEIHGTCTSRFAFVRDLLVREIRQGRVLGQAVALVLDGEIVAHVWAGYRDTSRRSRWCVDTLSCLFSASKPLAALAVLKLVDEGRLGLDDPIAMHWPGFAGGGKETVTIRHALAHLAGVPSLDAGPELATANADSLARAMELQSPAWHAGTQLCFHSVTHGILTSELVRRVTGGSLGTFVRDRIARPYRLDVAFELDDTEQDRCADVELVADNALFRMMTDPTTSLGQSWRRMDWTLLNSPTFREQGLPSIAGHGSALGLARYYGAMANEGRLDGTALLDSALVREVLTEQSQMFDPFMGAPVRMGLAHMLANEVFPFTGGGAFGQPGLGGVVGLGDAQHRLGVGIVCNRLAAGLENPFLDALLTGLAERL
jgi:CubicO group peptidase (beta-lactamase class C family)